MYISMYIYICMYIYIYVCIYIYRGSDKQRTDTATQTTTPTQMISSIFSSIFSSIGSSPWAAPRCHGRSRWVIHCTGQGQAWGALGTLKPLILQRLLELVSNDFCPKKTCDLSWHLDAFGDFVGYEKDTVKGVGVMGYYVYILGFGHFTACELEALAYIYLLNLITTSSRPHCYIVNYDILSR